MDNCKIIYPGSKIEYTKRPVKLEKYKLVPEPVTGYNLYDGSKGGWYLIQPHETYNLVKNPTFFMSLNGWSSFNSYIARTNANFFSMGFSMRIQGSGNTVIEDTREYAEIELFDYQVDKFYTASAYLWSMFIWDVLDPVSLSISLVDYDGVTYEEIFSNPVTRYQSWERVFVSKNIRPGATKLFLRINLRGNVDSKTGNKNSSLEYLYADAVQVEPGIVASTFFHGSYSTNITEKGYYKWLGPAHNSISYRSPIARDGGFIVHFYDLGVNILEHTGHGSAPIDNLSESFYGGVGEIYKSSSVDTNLITFTCTILDTHLLNLKEHLTKLRKLVIPTPYHNKNKILLLYKFDECPEDCSIVAYDVVYNSGLEGSRNNLYQENFVLQFKAFNPYPYEYPIELGKGLSLETLITSPYVVKVGESEIKGYPINPNVILQTIECTVDGSIFLGGTFIQINDYTVGDNVAIFDCDTACNLVGAKPVFASATDQLGNIVFVGDDLAPGDFQHYIALLDFETKAISYYLNSLGSVPFCVHIPFWAEWVVGDDQGIRIGITDKNCNLSTTFFNLGGDVLDINSFDNGNLIIVGAFTNPPLESFSVGYVIIYNVNVNGCFDLDTAEFQNIGFAFSGFMRSITKDNKNNMYIGGDALEIIPNYSEVCNFFLTNSYDSNAADQEIRFTNSGGGIIVLDVRVKSVILRDAIVSCLSQGYVGIGATNTTGVSYNFLIASVNVTSTATSTVGQLYRVALTINTNISIPEPCLSLNPDLVSTLTNSYALITSYAAKTLPGGTGIDNTVNVVNVTCGTAETVYEPDSITINRVVKVGPNYSITPLGEGRPASVVKVLYDRNREELLAAMSITAPNTNGLAVFNGITWLTYPAFMGGVDFINNPAKIVDMAYCPNDGSIAFLHNGIQNSNMPGKTLLSYFGDVFSKPTLYVHGPCKLVLTQKHTEKIRYCLDLQYDEVLTVDYFHNKIYSNFRTVIQSLESGAKYNVLLENLLPNYYDIYVQDTESETKATLVYKNIFYGIDGACNVEREIADILRCCNTKGYFMYRNPTDLDDESQGYIPGDMWINQTIDCNNKSIFLFLGSDLPGNSNVIYTGASYLVDTTNTPLNQDFI